MGDGSRSERASLLDPRFEDLTAQREAVMDALAPPGSIGWLRNQARGIRYKPGWTFEIIDPLTDHGAFIGEGRFLLAITVTDPNRRLRLQEPRIISPMPPGCEDQILSLHSSIMPYISTAAEFAAQARHIINRMEQEITDRWLRYE